ncbi:MAG: hypothetical protein JWO58_2850 [Chitinophagaceae bacterium]|nr:hypothetical protein [Chitinophagaceae bacterium]
MGRQKGILKLNGTLEGISFYQRNGQDLVRVANGPDKNKILNNPNFIRTRENNQEFGGAAMIGKALRLGVVREFSDMSDSLANSRIVKIVKEMINRGSGNRGQRAFTPVPLGPMLLNFPFSEKVSFDSICLAPYTVVVNAGRNEVTFTFADFNTGNMIHAPNGATHVRLINLISVLSQYNYNVLTKKYEPTDAIRNSMNAFSASDYMLLGGEVGAVTTLTSTIDLGSNPLLDSSALISCIGVEFYQDLGGTKYLLSSGNAMKIQGVY